MVPLIMKSPQKLLTSQITLMIRIKLLKRHRRESVCLRRNTKKRLLSKKLEMKNKSKEILPLQLLPKLNVKMRKKRRNRGSIKSKLKQKKRLRNKESNKKS